MPLRIRSISSGSPNPLSMMAAPSAARARAMPRPMPLVDPVTRALREARLVMEGPAAMEREASDLEGLVPPKPETALEGKRIVAAPASVGQRVEVLDIAAADHHLVGFQRGLEPLDDVEHGLAPAPLAALLERGDADIVFIGPPFLVGEMGKLHRQGHIVGDHRRTEAGAEAEEQHPPAPIAA